VAVIAASAIIAGYQSVDRLLNPQPVSYPWVIGAAGLVGFGGNELVAIYRIRVGRQIGSAALVADGLHARAEGFTSLAVVASALGVLAGFPQADPIIGLAITVAILLVLRTAAVGIDRRLMDAVAPWEPNLPGFTVRLKVDSGLIALHGPGDVFAGADERVGATKSELGGQDPDRFDAVDAKEPDIVTEAIPR
jgi:hypothetical protein